MDNEVLLGWLVALAWAGLFIALPIMDIKRAGSVRTWLRQCATKPLQSLASLMIWTGMMSLLTWLLTGGLVPVQLGWFAPAGFVLGMIAHKRQR